MNDTTMTMTEPVEVEAVEALQVDPVSAAQARVDQLCDTARRGGTVTAKQLAEANAGVELARFQEEAKQLAEADRKESERLAKLETIRARTAAELDGKDVAAARETMRAAMDNFIVTCKSFDDRHKEILEPMVYDSSLQPLPPGMGNRGFNLWQLHIDDKEIKRATPQRDVSNAFREFFPLHYGPRTTYSLDSPRD